MTNFDYTKLKDYWKQKINALLAYKGVNVADLDEPNWEARLDEGTLLYRLDINQFAIDVCEDIYDKATVNVSNFPNDVSWRTHISLVGDNPKIASGDYWNTFWEYIDSWEKITQYHFWLLDSLKYSASVDDVDENDAWKSLKGLLNGNSLEEIITEKATLQAKADNYDRIHAKLSGRVSDAELDNLLTPPSPPCSHADYDAIKLERDTLKTELTSQELSFIDRIITDCELGADTEKTLDKLIVRIKELIKDNDIISPAVKNEVIKVSKELGLSDNFQQKLSETTTYSSLIDVQKQAFSSKLSESKSEISKYQNRSNWAIGLGSLSFAGLLVLAYLLLRKKQQENKEDIE